jgi:2-polyprenyl-3-methyl-5-hydroxy-6-metoxy-1,4-benzoquinol methylase
MKFELLQNHPMITGNHKIGWGNPTDYRDDELLESICDYFDKRTKIEPISYENSVWFNNVERQKPIIDLLQRRDLDALHELFRNMFSSPLTHGTAQGDVQTQQFRNDPSFTARVVQGGYDRLVSLMEMFEIIPLFSPEEYSFNNRFDYYFTISADEYIKKLMDKFNVDLTAPKYSGNLLGMDTSYGIYNERDIIAIGIALLIHEKFPDKSMRICEIGGGTGHLAYYLYKLGYENITIVDLPTISLSQMYFLSVNLGKDKVKLLAPQEFTGDYDIVVNVDSMTEMNIESATEYCDKMMNKALFISINHEANSFTVADVCKMQRVSRNLFWLRRGYIIEEFI